MTTFQAMQQIFAKAMHFGCIVLTEHIKGHPEIRFDVNAAILITEEENQAIKRWLKKTRKEREEGESK